MGTVITLVILVLLAIAVFFAGRSIHRRKGRCSGSCAGCSGCLRSCAKK